MPSSNAVVVGVDVGGTKTHAAAFGRDLQTLLEVREPTKTGSASVVVDSVCRTVSAVVEQLDGAPLSAIGIGIPGRIDNRHSSVSQAVNLGIGEVPAKIAERISDTYGVSCTLENDVNAAALGAFRLLNSEQDIRDLAYLSIGTGIAAGLILDGKIHRGGRGVAGEIGHFPMTTDGPKCECGLQGCLEAVASGSAIARRWPSGGDVDPGSALVRAAQEGNPSAIEVLTDISDHLARAVHLLALTYDVDLVVLGGGVANIGEPLLEHIGLGLRRLEAESAFVQTLGLRDLLVLPPSASSGVLGAAVVGVMGSE